MFDIHMGRKDGEVEKLCQVLSADRCDRCSRVELLQERVEDGSTG